MVSKTKKKVKNTVVKRGTLDQAHTEKIIRFEKLQSSLPNKKQKLQLYQVELKKLLSMHPNEFSHEDIRKKTLLIDKINKLNNKIKTIENCTESLNYVVKTLPILLDYYDENNTFDCIEEDVFNDIPQDNQKNNILSYFAKETQSQIQTKNKSEPLISNKLSKAKLYENYLCLTDDKHQKNITNKDNICSVPDCGGIKSISHADGYLVCRSCGFAEEILLVTDKPSYKEPTQDSGTYAYKRINHLTEILSQLQAKESTDIPQQVFIAIRREIRKRKINKNDLDIFKLRRVLKKLEYRKYYEHVPHILQIINGKQPPNFSRNEENSIKKMFKDIQKPFSIYCPKNRKNFLNYSYVLHKFCELLMLDDYINYFPLLKNTAKLRQHDRIWKNICEYMEWKFYKSI